MAALIGTLLGAVMGMGIFGSLFGWIFRRLLGMRAALSEVLGVTLAVFVGAAVLSFDSNTSYVSAFLEYAIGGSIVLPFMLRKSKSRTLPPRQEIFTSPSKAKETNVAARRHTGWKRLGIVLGVPYFGFWSFFLVANFLNYESVNAHYGSDMAVGNYFTLQVDSSTLSQNMGNIILSIVWGIIVPILVVAVWHVVAWVARGFSLDKASARNVEGS